MSKDTAGSQKVVLSSQTQKLFFQNDERIMLI